MVSSRDKLKERGLVQIAVWLSQDSAALLKRLAAERGQSATKVVEQGIMALAAQPDESTEPASSDFDLWNRVAELAAALERTNARLSALEAPRAPVAADAPAEGVSEVEPAEVALPGASTAMPEPVPVKVFAELPSVERAKAVAAMQAMRRRGLSYREISAALLEQHGVVTASGNALWPGQVKKILNEQSD